MVGAAHVLRVLGVRLVHVRLRLTVHMWLRRHGLVRVLSHPEHARLVELGLGRVRAVGHWRRQRGRRTHGRAVSSTPATLSLIIVLVATWVLMVGISRRSIPGRGTQAVRCVRGIDMHLWRACLSVLTAHLERSHDGSQALVVRGIPRWKSRHCRSILLRTPGLPGWGVVGVGGWIVGNGQAHFLDETAVRLGGRNLQLDEHALCGLYVTLLVHGVDERAGENLVHDRNTIDLVAKNIVQDMVTWGVE